MSTVLRTKTVRWVALSDEDRRTLVVALKYWSTKWAMARALPATPDGQAELARIQRLIETLQQA